MKKEKVIESCYSQLRKVTPLDFDCGKICDGKCCKGDEKTGMIIFPGEEKFIDESMKIFKNEEGDTVRFVTAAVIEIKDLSLVVFTPCSRF